MEVGVMGSMHRNRARIRDCRQWEKVGLVRRHVLGALAGVLSLALVLAACGNEQGGGGTGGGTTAHKIKMVAASYSDKTQGYWQDVIKRFEQQNPGTTVELQVIDWNNIHQQVNTMIQTRQMPDVLNIDDWVAYANQGLLYPARDVLDPQVQSDFLPSFTKNGELNGTQYGIPFIASVRALGYNQKLFSEIGIQSPPKTWQELEASARKAKAKGDIGYGLPLGSEEAQAEFSLFMWGNGGDWKQGDKWTVNSPQNVAALQFMKKLTDEGVTEPNPGKTNRTDGVWKLFAQGKVAMAAIMPLGTFANSTMKDASFKWASSPFPVNQGNPEFTLGVMDSLMAFKKAGNQEAVKKFLSFVYQKDNYLKFNQIEGFLPVTASASEAMKTDPVAGPGIALLPKARFYPLTDPNWGKVRGAVLNQLGTALEPNGDPKKVLDAIQQVAEQGG
jgi:multiple sugar transport system substrate-binding protein